MATRINSTGRSIAVSGKNGYTVEKVKKAVEFVKHATRRGTKFEDYLNMYNYLKGTNETLPNCKVCGAAKYIAAVENYAKYGYLTLVASGVDPDILNGNKKEDEGDNFRSNVSDNGETKPVETEDKAVEAQEGTQEASENTSDTGVHANGNGMVQYEEDATEVEESVGVEANKKRTKKVSKKG